MLQDRGIDWRPFIVVAQACNIKKRALNTLLGYTVLRLKARMLPLTVAGANVLSPSSDPENFMSI